MVGNRKQDIVKFTYLYGMSGTAPYVRFVNKNVGKVYDVANTELADSPTWTDTDVALTDQVSSRGGWLVPIPAGIPDGPYDMLIYDSSVAAGSRSSSDVVSRGKHVSIKNEIIKFIYEL